MLSQLRRAVAGAVIVLFGLIGLINRGSYEYPPVPGGTLKVRSVKGESEPKVVDTLNYAVFYLVLILLILATIESRGRKDDL